jgi:hypothetical protein
VASASAANLALQAEVSSVSQELAAAQEALAAAQREIQQQQTSAEERQRRFMMVQVGVGSVGGHWGTHFTSVLDMAGRHCSASTQYIDWWVCG